jgi:hypothetical protein
MEVVLMMVTPIEKEVAALRKDVDRIKLLLEEDFELSDEAETALKKARDSPDSEYVEL